MRQQGQRITATNAAADQLGFYAGMPLADARAIHPSLIVNPADPQGDSVALKRLALWHQCYSPYTRVDAPDGLAIDITGCAHLFGGEAAMLKEIGRRLKDFGLTARLAAAPTISAAWAAARHAPGTLTLITGETLHDHLAPLPAAALRLEEPCVAALKKLGLKQIRDLLGKPRAPLAARFGSALVARLDQAFGKEAESFSPLSPPPVYRAERRFTEPVVTIPAIEHAVHHLARDLAETLKKAGKGARKVTFSLFRVDGWSQTLAVQTSALPLSRDAAHLARLLCERLDTIRDHTGFGFEAAALNAFCVEKYNQHQNGLDTNRERRENPDDLARLLDRLVNRFGAQNVTRFTPNASYIPERSVHSTTALQGAEHYDWNAHARMLQGGDHISRPVLIFASPESVTTLAEVPDGPPIRFEWRRISYRIVRADGPERIAPEWWRKSEGESRQTRDYYRVEDEEGRRFWLYRDGLHEREGDQPRWLIHGVFA
jgi:protein ImuB